MKITLINCEKLYNKTIFSNYELNNDLFEKCENLYFESL